MTRSRIYGEDSSFGRWVRNRPELDSIAISLSVNDRDFTFHHFKTNVDGVGTRDVQLMLGLEVKTRSALPSRSQHETKFFEHQLLNQKCWVQHPAGRRIRLWHFGYYFLSLLDDVPEDGDESYVTWIGFTPAGGLDARTIRVATMIEILQFTRRPDTLEPLDLRRHHKTQRLLECVEAPLGFLYERLVSRRS